MRTGRTLAFVIAGCAACGAFGAPAPSVAPVPPVPSVAPVAPTTPLAVETWRYTSAGQVVAFGDVHGAYDALVATLRQAGVLGIDERWSGGRTTLISLGDLVDRGPSSRRVLDLLMRLEREAAMAGGAVRVLLGNHEVMTLLGERRDVSALEYAEFAADERHDERSAAQRRFVAAHIAAGSAEPAARAEFAQRFPPGWFARRAAFAGDGRYGAWLLSKPVAIVVDDTAFVHGGFSRLVADRDLIALNVEFHAKLIGQLADVAALERAGRLDPTSAGEHRAETLAASLPPAPAPAPTPSTGAAPPRPPSPTNPPTPLPSATDALAERALRFDLDPLFRLQGPHWYRGLALCHDATERGVAEAARARLGVERIVVGHTPNSGARIRSRFGGRVVMIDTGMLHQAYGGQGSALMLDAEGLAAVYQDGTRAAVEPDPRLVALGPVAGDAPLLEALAGWAITSDEPAAGERRLLKLAAGTRTLSAWFYTDRARGGRAVRELAAYGLDRALGLGLVPPTVARSVGGVAGVLQWRPDGSLTAAQAQTTPPSGTQWCDMPAQLDLLYAWDALTLNEGRTLDSIAYTDADWLVTSSDHRRAFGETVARPGHLVERTLTVGAELCRRLGALGSKGLRGAVGKSLSGKEQTALLKRRDKLVREAGCAR